MATPKEIHEVISFYLDKDCSGKAIIDYDNQTITLPFDVMNQLLSAINLKPKETTTNNVNINSEENKAVLSEADLLQELSGANNILISELTAPNLFYILKHLAKGIRSAHAGLPARSAFPLHTVKLRNGREATNLYFRGEISIHLRDKEICNFKFSDNIK